MTAARERARVVRGAWGESGTEVHRCVCLPSPSPRRSPPAAGPPPRCRPETRRASRRCSSTATRTTGSTARPAHYGGAWRRRLEVAGRHRLAAGARLGRRLRLHQGDRGRRPRRRPLPAELARRRGRRDAARGLSLLLFLLAPAPTRRPGSSATSRRSAARCRRCSTWNGTTTRAPAPAGPRPRKCAPRWRCSSTLVTRHYGQRPVIYVTPDFYRENQLGRLTGASFWLRSVAGHPSDGLPGPGLGVLAVHRHRHGPRHLRPRRPQRLRRLAGAVAGLGGAAQPVGRPRRRRITLLQGSSH